jgi:membrane associated rhomboid family serine protease
LASPTDGDPRWYIYVDGKSFGPYGRSDVERMIQNRQLQARDYLCPEGAAEWIEARNDPTFGHLLSELVDFAAILPDRPAKKSAAGIKVYRPKSGAQLWLALLAFAMSTFGLVSLKPIFDWLSGGPRPEGGILLAAASLLFLPIGILFLSNALRGLPRLTVTAEGIKFEDGIRTRWATWDSVGPFAVKAVYSGRSRQTRMAFAKIAGAAAGRSRRRARDFTISDHFTVPIDAIVAELNAARTLATGDSVAAIEDSNAKETSLGLAQFKVPWLTFAILVVLIAVFTLEIVFAVAPGGRTWTPSIATLVAFGALSHKLVVSYGEWYRLFTAPLLHANLPHILGNGVALVLGGWLLERLVGRLWFFGFFTIGALGGSLFSLAINPVNLVSVGASGALMGLFAALLVASFRYASGTAARTRLQLNSLRILIPSLLPFLQTSSAGRIDYGAHIGGTLSGAALALVLLKCWPEGARIPQLRKAAAGVSAIGVLLFVASGGLAVANYPKFVSALQHAQPAAPSPALEHAQPAAPSPPLQGNAQPASPSPPTDVLSDHGPKRAACDFKWGTLHLQDSDYPTFLQKCMSESSTSP